MTVDTIKYHVTVFFLDRSGSPTRSPAVRTVTTTWSTTITRSVARRWGSPYWMLLEAPRSSSPGRRPSLKNIPQSTARATPGSEKLRDYCQTQKYNRPLLQLVKIVLCSFGFPDSNYNLLNKSVVFQYLLRIALLLLMCLIAVQI